MKISADDYPIFRDWFAVMSPIVAPWAVGDPDIDPVQILDAMAKQAPAKARLGLAMAIGDTLEESADWDAVQIAQVDETLKQQGLPTLSRLRAQFSREINRIRARGEIRNEREYYAVRNVADHANEADRKVLWDLLSAYELRLPSK